MTDPRQILANWAAGAEPGYEFELTRWDYEDADRLIAALDAAGWTLTAKDTR